MFIRMEGSEAQPYFLRVAAGVRRAIAEESVAPGERLPQAKELAEGLGVNLHTVLRAYGVLRDEGLVEMGRGRAVRVAPAASAGRARVAEMVERLAAEARRWGLAPEEAGALVTEAMR
jgi:DNA-binding transcriptional regulator YhcF (GntR family)